MKLKTSMFKPREEPVAARDPWQDIAKVLSPKEDTKSKKDLLSLRDKLSLFTRVAPQSTAGESDKTQVFNYWLVQYAKNNKTRRSVFSGLPTGGADND